MDEELEGERRLAVLVSRGKAFWMGRTASARPSGVFLCETASASARVSDGKRGLGPEEPEVGPDPGEP